MPTARLSLPFHLSTLLAAACGCLLVARTVNLVVEASLEPLPAPVLTTPRTPARAEVPVAPLSAERLARYTGLYLPEPPGPLSPADAGAEEAIGTSTSLRLLGTLVSTRTETSRASLYEEASRRARTVGVGSALAGAEVLSIERTRVLVSSAGRPEWVLAASVEAPGRASLPEPPRAPAPQTGPRISVRQVGPDAYVLKASEVRAALADINSLASQARMVPAVVDGVPQGFRVFAIRPGSFYEQLGLRNGDTLRRINGLPLDTVENALEALVKLRDSNRIELELQRDGRRVRSTYTLGD